jgi:CubicO group peptidase (beta-lactamase class C family)
MPAGGYFSTANDVGRFCQMVLNGGTFEGKRYLSQDAVKQMTSKQTAEAVKTNWGLGWSVGNDSFGHGGAHATSMTVNTKHQLVLVLLMQHAGFPDQMEGGKITPTFQRAAIEKYGSK